MPETVVLEPWKRLGHVALAADEHDSGPIQVEGFHQFEGWLYEVLRDLALNNKVHHREEDERFVGCLKAGEGGPSLPVLVRPEVREHLKVFIEHSFTAPIAAGTSNSEFDLLSLNVESRAKLMNFTISGASL
jgi:hypothetical protein